MPTWLISGLSSRFRKDWKSFITVYPCHASRPVIVETQDAQAASILLAACALFHINAYESTASKNRTNDTNPSLRKQRLSTAFLGSTPYHHVPGGRP